MSRRWTTRIAFAMGFLLLMVSFGVAIVRSSMDASTEAAGAPAGSATQSRPSTPASPNVLFSDNFQRDAVGANPPIAWTEPDGRWSGVVRDATEVVRHAHGPYGHLVTGSAAWTDYTVSADVMPTPLSTGFAAVAGRYQGPGDYYQCDIHHAGSLQLWRLRRGVPTLLDSRSVTIDPTRFSNVRLVMTGNQLSCLLNGVRQLTATDGSLTHGQIALVAGDNDTAEFANVTVTSP